MHEYEFVQVDKHNWEIALKSDKPIETYQELREKIETPDTPEEMIDNLPNAAWLRAT